MKTKAFFEKIRMNNTRMSTNFPTKDSVHTFVNDTITFLFPICHPSKNHKTEIAWKYLHLQLKELLMPLSDQISDSGDEIVEQYFNQLPDIYELLLIDAKAILDFDPAAKSIEEILLAYPGFYAIMVYRLAHPLYRYNIPLLPRMMSEYAHAQTGIDIHPGAQIGTSFFIDHGTGIVIGETTIIGNNVKIYQGVTLGALSVKKEEAQTKRHPTIEDEVIIYSGSTILGGKTIIGHHSVIGGNVWLTESVSPYSMVYHKSEVKIKNARQYEEAINFVI